MARTFRPCFLTSSAKISCSDLPERVASTASRGLALPNGFCYTHALLLSNVVAPAARRLAVEGISAVAGGGGEMVNRTDFPLADLSISARATASGSRGFSCRRGRCRSVILPGIRWRDETPVASAPPRSFARHFPGILHRTYMHAVCVSFSTCFSYPRPIPGGTLCSRDAAEQRACYCACCFRNEHRPTQ